MSERKFAIDFDGWAELAKQDPERFEQLRKFAIDAKIQRCSSNNQERLRRLQWRVDRVREQSKTPMAACVAISDMMWDSLQNLNDRYQVLTGLARLEAIPSQSGARLLTFPAPKRRK